MGICSKVMGQGRARPPFICPKYLGGSPAAKPDGGLAPAPPATRQSVLFIAPPSSKMFCPMMKPAYCEHRKAQAAPNSSGVP